MTAALITNLAIVILPICCLALLAAIGIQLDFGQPEHAPPTFKPGYVVPSQRAEWAADFAAVREEIAAEQPNHIGRPPMNLHTSGKAHDDWKFNTAEWEGFRDSFFEDQSDDQAVVYTWAGAGR